MENLVTDISVYLPWIARKNADQTVTLTGLKSDGSAFDFSPYTFITEIWRFGGSAALIAATTTNNGIAGTLTISLTAAQLNIAASQDYFWVIRTTAPTKIVWINGPFLVNSSVWNGSPTTSISTTINTGTQNISLTLSLGSGSGGGASALTRTSVKTANYYALANDMIPVDTTSGSVQITLPNASTDKTQVSVKHIIRGGTNVVTVVCSGADVFNKTAGGTSLTITLLNQALWLQYDSSTKIWTVLADDLSLSQLDARYAVLDSPAFINNPTAPTQSVGDNSNRLATMAALLQAASSAGLQPANNLSDVASVNTSRQNLKAANRAQSVPATITDADKTLAASDFIDIVLQNFTSSSAHTITVPNDSSGTIDVGSIYFFVRLGTGAITVSPAGGVTLDNTFGGFLDSGQNQLTAVQKIAANHWKLFNGKVSVAPTQVTLSASALTITNMPAGVLELSVAKRYRTKFDLSKYTQIRTIVSVSTVGFSGAGFYIQYSSDDTNFTDIGTGTTTNLALVTAIGTNVSDWITIPNGALTDIILRIVSIGGNGATSPVIGTAGFQLK